MIRGKERFLHQLYFIVDFLVIQLAFLITWWIRFELFVLQEGTYLPFIDYALWGVLYGVLAILVGYYVALYSPKRKKKFAIELFNVIQVHIITIFMLTSILYITKTIHISRLFLFTLICTSLTLIIIYRSLLKYSLRELRKRGYNKQFVLVIGAGSIGNHFHTNLKKHPEYGLEVLGFLDDTNKRLEQDYPPILGGVKDIDEILKKHPTIDEVVIALPIYAHEKFNEIITSCEKEGVRALIIPDFYNMLPSTPHFYSFANIPMINTRDVPLDEMRNRFFKRVFDITFSLSVLTLLSPVFMLIAVGVKITSPGPILFKQKRIGLNKKEFVMYKFRSMKVSSSFESDTKWSSNNDPRRIKFGSFLRKTSLDELPQFINVLKGDMSVVGPRPERPYFVYKFKDDIPSYMIKHHVNPGITGWAQVCGFRGDTSIKERINHDLFYIENWTLLFDLKIIILTLNKNFLNDSE